MPQERVDINMAHRMLMANSPITLPCYMLIQCILASQNKVLSSDKNNSFDVYSWRKGHTCTCQGFRVKVYIIAAGQ